MEKLGMESLILHPTDIAQWHALVNEAQANRELTLGEELESYLVFLLMRFASQPEMASSLLGMEFLEGVQATGQKRYEVLRDLGDKCLLFSGLFPGRAQRRRVKVSYFVDIGQTAYGTLSSVEQQSVAKLFAELSQGFVPLMDVLQGMRSLSEQASKLLPLEALELWQDTGSQSAREALQACTNGMPLSGNKKSH